MGAKTIIILGTGTSMRFCDFNYKDGKIIPNSEIWGVNGTYTTPLVMPEKHRDKFWMSKLFMGDTLFSFETGTLNFDIDGINKFAEKYKCEMYSVNKLRLGKHVMNAKKYPYTKIRNYFGCELFTDTICYMIAYALWENSCLAENQNGVIRPELEHPLTLKLFGIDMCTTQEYQQSKAGVEHWLGVARGMGCEITVAPGSSIFSNPYNVPYGFWHRLKWKKKDYDPMNLMKGKEPTTKDADEMEAKLRREENDKGTGTTDEEWLGGNQSEIIVRHS